MSPTWQVARDYRTTLKYLLTLVLILTTVTVEAAAATPVVPRSAVNCGPNAMYIFLILCGAEPSQAAIESIVCGTDGTSFLDLSRFAVAQGVPTEICLYQPGEFQRIRLPAICQTRDGPPKHFVVAYDVDATGLYTIDSTTGEYHRVRAERIASYLSGYALIRKRTMLSVFIDNQPAVCFCLLAGAALMLRGQRGARSMRNTARANGHGHCPPQARSMQ
jgi:hypothetical protein